ncbi:retinoic acid receptor RXR-alpha-B-like [Clytia hemisphaerica]|uniref:Retinoid X receptor n=1 Tax=Clytia hemisphaerica TaxID=252671 RepID=A0A7M6DMN0_9CNID|eukprot:TCONS_00006052-protein
MDTMISSSSDEPYLTSDGAISSTTSSMTQSRTAESYTSLLKDDTFTTQTPISPQSSISSIKSPDSTTLQLNSPPSDMFSPPPSAGSSNTIDTNPSTSDIYLGASPVKIARTTSSTSSSFSNEQCTVCGDKATYSVFGAASCDSCGGFFKRAVKNSREYTCETGKRDCLLNKKTRNRCKACRLQRCYKVGMSSNAAKEYADREKMEKTRKKEDKIQQVVSSSHSSSPMEAVQTIEIKEINDAELYVDPKINAFANIAVDPIRQLCLAADKQLASLAEWAKRMPHFTTLNLSDQVKLLQWNWAELLIGGFCYRSSAVSDGILLATGLHLSRDNLQKAGVGAVVNKLFSEVINKMQKLQIDVSEWGCLRAIMLFAPDTKELTDPHQVEAIRQRYVATLCDYHKKQYKEDPNRLGNLLLRLPPLKAIALQVLEHLFFFKLIGDVPIDTFLMEMLDVDSH